MRIMASINGAINAGWPQEPSKLDMVKLKSSTLEIGFGEIQFSKLKRIRPALVRCALCEQSAKVNVFYVVIIG